MRARDKETETIGTVLGRERKERKKGDIRIRRKRGKLKEEKRVEEIQSFTISVFLYM